VCGSRRDPCWGFLVQLKLHRPLESIGIAGRRVPVEAIKRLVVNASMMSIANKGVVSADQERTMYLELDLGIIEEDLVKINGGCSVNKWSSGRSDRFFQLLWRQRLTLALPANHANSHKTWRGGQQCECSFSECSYSSVETVPSSLILFHCAIILGDHE